MLFVIIVIIYQFFMGKINFGVMLYLEVAATETK